MTKEEIKKLLQLAVKQHQELVNLLTQILTEIKNK
jgi:ribonuclease PH